MNSIVSPFDNKSVAIFVRNVSVKNIVKSYKQTYNIDVSTYFNQLENIAIYQCELSSFKFFYPYNLSGDSKFYEFFQKFAWYYNPWKWEHEISLQYITNGYKVLEVGCGKGAFLEKISEEYQLDEATGLELNESTQIVNKKWKIVNELIEEYQVNHSEKYDVVCSYQVLEHISDVNSFIRGKINCLKKGGKLIIAVPNNESFLKNIDSLLNLPPHHMGLWDASSLTSLAQIYPIHLEKIHLEPLQEYHIDSYIDSKIYGKYNKVVRKIIRKFDKLTGKYAEIFNGIKLNSNNIIGITILAVFEKH